ncbi:type II toxin-antitoxin system mRNA interferase toxin, RelE/StbE family [Patescibacteria group bacterium]|nr:type II toxin-antitoxin system mRNA interferase toxin, RelE/StbE family [Patescibacteria group bacterium]MBU2260205.1 type II toxin-antitoxin system mRNA interferase toxin, RelE/StbE family [Patescibacteria group bacterium]
MITVRYKSSFVRQYKKLSSDLQQEMREKIDLFKQDPRNVMLKVHKLGGKLRGSLAFSVNYRYRIVFEWEEKDVAVLLDVGDHNVYR